MESINFSCSKDELIQEIKKLNSELIMDAFKNSITPKKSQYGTRQEVADEFRITTVSVDRLSKRNILKPYKLNGRILFKWSEVYEALVKSDKLNEEKE